MRLQDARKLAIRRQTRIRFRLAAGLDAVINEHGLAQVPGLAAPPDFSLEDEFARATVFTLEPAAGTGRPESLLRDDLEKLAATGPAAAPEAEE